MQRTCQARLFADGSPAFTFWGWQAVIVAAAITLPLGITQGKEYAELEWPIDILIAVVWVAYCVVFFGTLAQAQGAAHLRRELVLRRLHRHRRDAAHRQQPGDAGVVRRTKTYSVYAGVQDAMVQWWYGHNAVGFFLTAGFLGMMYYFMPKQAERPVYSYRLSIVHFWALIFTLHVGGPAPPALHRAARLGAVARHGVLADAAGCRRWGGMINGLMTLVGRVAQAAHRSDPEVHDRVAVASTACRRSKAR